MNAAAAGVVVETRPVGSEFKRLRGRQSARLADLGQVERHQGVGMHADALFGARRVRRDRLAQRANAAGFVPGVVHDQTVSLPAAADGLEIKLDAPGDFGLGPPPLHDAVHAQIGRIGRRLEIV